MKYDQAAMVGTPRNWIERAVAQPVAYVFAGDTAAVNIVWQQRFWNPLIRHVLAVPPNAVLGPIPAREVAPAPNGLLAVDERYVVANDDLTFVGTPVAHQDRGPDYPGLTLWRLNGPPRISTARSGVKPNGDMYGTAQIVAWGCGGGQFEVTLIPKATNEVTLTLDGQPVSSAHVEGREYWNGAVTVPRRHPQPCVFGIRGGALLGSTLLAFVPAG